LKEINYQAYVKKTKQTKDHHVYSIEKYLGEVGGKHKYKIRFAECGRVKTVTYEQINAESVTYYFRKPPAMETKRKVIKKKKEIFIPKDTVVMGLDASTNKTGYSIFKNGKLIDYGLISKNHNDRTHRITLMVTEIFKKFKEYNCNYAVIEDIYMGDNVTTLVVLAALQGVLLYILDANNIPSLLVPPVTWKSHFGILKHRTQGKELAINKVKEKYQIIDVNDDTAESILIAQYFSDKYIK